MPVYTYKARTQSGEIKKGEVEAENERALNAKLAQQGYLPVEIKLKPRKEESFIGGMAAKFRERVPLKSLAIFARQFSTMINAGLSLVKCLDILAEQTEDKTLRKFTVRIKQSVEDGSTLANAFEQFPRTFNKLFVNLVHAGEVGGVLDEVMDRLAGFLEKDQQLRSKIRSSMTYPAIILFVAIGVVIFLVTFVLPTFIQMFEGMDLELPIMTKMLLAVSEGLRKYWYIFLLSLFFGLVGLGRYIATPAGKRQFDQLVLKLPVFGPLNQKVAISRFARTLSTLLASGVPVLQAMEVVAEAAGNVVVTKAVMTARTSIKEGESIAGPLGASGIFPPMVTQMIAVGEETGNLETMLTKVSDFYDLEVDATVSALTSLLEPLLMVGMGVIVGFIVIAMFLPMFQLIQGIQ